MKLRLSSVKCPKGHNAWCGPAVISALSGCDTNTAAYHFREVSGRSSIKGTYTHEVRKVLQRMGIVKRAVYRDYSKPAPTLAQWLKDHPRPSGVVYLLDVGSHWALVSGQRWVCSITAEVVSVKDKRTRPRARVHNSWILEAKEGVKPLCLPPVRKSNGALQYRLRKVRAEAESLGFQIDLETGMDSKPWYCFHTDEDIDLAISGGDEHYARGPEELLEKLTDWVDAYKKLP